MSATIAVPSRGRLRDACLALLDRAGYAVSALDDRKSLTSDGDLEFIEMRPADAAAWLAAGQLDAAFVSTDGVFEHEIETWPTIALGFGRSDLVVACRSDAPYESLEALAGKIVATHLPRQSARLFAEIGVKVEVVTMGGALEGVCAAGLAEAIVDLSETGTSLAQNRLRVLSRVRPCEALFVRSRERSEATDDLVTRLTAVLGARHQRYLMLHIAPDRLDRLSELFPGLASPTVLPLSGRSDLVAVHLIVEDKALWEGLSALRSIGASGIVVLPTDAILR